MVTPRSASPSRDGARDLPVASRWSGWALAKTYLERDLSTSRRILEAEAATFDKPATVVQRFKQDFAGLFEDQL